MIGIHVNQRHLIGDIKNSTYTVVRKQFFIFMNKFTNNSKNNKKDKN